MNESPSTVESIEESACLALLETQQVGRLAVVVQGQPTVYPVNYKVDGNAIVFRTAIGTKFVHSSLDRVAFEVDDIDVENREGWSVVIEGTGRDVTNAIDDSSVREQELQIDSWVSGDHSHVVRIIASKIEGRQIIRAKSSSANEP